MNYMPCHGTNLFLGMPSPSVWLLNAPKIIKTRLDLVEIQHSCCFSTEDGVNLLKSIHMDQVL